MSDVPINKAEPDARGDEKERIRSPALDEGERICDRIGAEAQARGPAQENPGCELETWMQT